MTPVSLGVIVVVLLVGSLISNARKLEGENITSSHQKRNLLYNFNHKNTHCNPTIGRWRGNKAEEGEVPCLVALSRFRENDNLKRFSAKLHHNIPLIVLNTGDSLHDYCDYPILANVGRESFHYLHYIVEYYHHPDYFAPYNIFCQADIDYETISIVPYLNNHLCNPNQAHKMKLKGGFSFFGNTIYPFHIGLLITNDTYYAEGIKQIYGELGGLNKTQEWMKFVPQGCFVVTKTQLYTRPYQYYFQALKWITKGVQPDFAEASLNEANSPAIGHLMERAWPQIFNSSCQHENPWCCMIDCALINI